MTANPKQPDSGNNLPTLDASLAGRLRAVVSRLRGYLLVEGFAWVVGFVLVGGVVQFVLDYGTHGLQWSMRAALLALIVLGAALLILRRIIQPMRLAIGPAEAACLVERRHPDLDSVLISAVRFASHQSGPPEANSPVLMASVIEQASKKATSVDFGEALDPRRARRSAFGLAASLIVVVGAVVAAPEVMSLWFTRNVMLQDVPWPRRTTLVVELEDGRTIGARGDDLIIHAHAEGVQPREVEIVFTTESGQRGRETMVTVGRPEAYKYRYTFKDAEEDFEFYLRGGDDVTETYRAILVDRPKVISAEMRIVPPAYTRMPTFKLGDDRRTTKVVPGSEVTISVATNKSVVRAVLMAGNDVVTEPSFDGGRFAATVAPLETATYHFALEDEAGLENVNPARFSIRVVKDDPPRVRMKLEGVGDMITPQARLPIEVSFSDTYGLASAELLYTVTREGEDREEGAIVLPTFKPHSTTFLTELSWPVSELSLVPGDVLTLTAQAEDFDSVSGPNQSRSSPVTLRVVTRDDLLSELARREQEYRMDFERLVDNQERLRSDLLTILGSTTRSLDAAELAEALSPQERRQRSVSASANVVRQQFERIFKEMTINRLDTPEDRERLSDGIITPLTRLAKHELADAADTIRNWARGASPDAGSRVDPIQVTVLSQMRKILAVMLQWEGYYEVVNMLRNIVRLQSELNAETEKAWLDQADDIFED